ncbi:LOW QUALITY PROTEIN: lactam utilization protein LamB [Geomicrobium sp. JCM 19039]|nr:LOW QUALITY PROTEIN: lactam utilization protein LamB [Geomicrobium sp. JCM 19039]
MILLRHVDFNADCGESFGVYTLGNDSEILTEVTSANIACGYHAGDPKTMRETVRLALRNGVQIGAHPGLLDPVGFGRRNMDISPEEAYDLVQYQVGALMAIAHAEGGEVKHVKAHGALYTMAAKSEALAHAIARAVYDTDARLVLYGLAGSEWIRAGERVGIQTASEVFADRTYEPSGSLTLENNPTALITDATIAAQQVIDMVVQGQVTATDGSTVAMQADTICIHGDGPGAVSFARVVRGALTDAGVSIHAFS